MILGADTQPRRESRTNTGSRGYMLPEGLATGDRTLTMVSGTATQNE
jgi:hypothetical protein